MTQFNVQVSTGSPRFSDDDLARIASHEGIANAWERLYGAHGERCLERVGGDFAVGIVAADGSAFCAVDRFAIRSLCYRIKDGTIRFAERAEALSDTGATASSQAVFDYLYFHVIPSPRTIFRDVFRLPAGHRLTFRNGNLHVAPYWTPEFEEPAKANFTSLKDEFVGILRECVSAQTHGVNTGCFLSGGTDSSTVAGMLGRVTGRPAPTFSIGFDADGYDEMEFSRIAARHFGTDHHEYYITPADLVRSIPDVATSYDQPFGNSSVLPAYYCARIAKEAGIERMLGGDGGDELFGGNTRYARQQVFGLYDHLPDGMRKGAIEPVFADRSIIDRIPMASKAASYVRQAMVPMPERMQTYNLLNRIGLQTVFEPDFLGRIDASMPHAHQEDVYRNCRARSLLNRMLAYDWRYTLAETDLPKVVGATRLAGMPVGFPLLDDRLVDFSLRLRSDYKVRRLKLRWFFKEALRGFLPDEIITKKKQGFGLPFGVWATRDAGLRALAEDSLGSLSTRGIVRPQFTQALMRDLLPSHPGYYGEMVWILMMLEQWLRKHAPGALGD